jgi:hypothetical protein
LSWIVAAPLLTGALILGVLSTPTLSAQAFLYIPVAAILGVVYGYPLACGITRFVAAPGGNNPLLRWGWGL